MEKKLQVLKGKLREIKNLQAAAAVLHWDQEVMMPRSGAVDRADQIATLEKLAHERLTNDEIGALLDDLSSANLEQDADDAALVRVTKRDFDLARKLPTPLVEEMANLFSIGQSVWAKARAENQFSQFQETLSRIVQLNIQKAEAYGYKESIYDALLDQYEPGLKTAEVGKVFDDLKSALVPLIQTIGSKTKAADDTFLRQDFEESLQEHFSLELLKAIGFDFDKGLQNTSTHPFTTGISTHDVRLTNRFGKNTFPSSVFAALHEGGHGLYEQNFAKKFNGNFLADAASVGVHESQSRLWENVVGRSRAFWQFFYPRLQELFPSQLKDRTTESFYRAINVVKPSLIRIESDEITYNMHIFIRFELEQALLEQRLDVQALPEAWNAKMEKYLGLTPTSDALGVLQDVHWSCGMMGYFPTYTLGNIMSVQFYEQAILNIPDLPQQFAKGQYHSLLHWLRENVHCHGRKYATDELLARSTRSRQLDAKPYLKYIKNKFNDIYGL